MKLPRHIALSISHNEHAGNYQTVAEYIGLGSERYSPRDAFDDEWAAPGEKEKAVATNELWECTWNPRTPVGSCFLAASTLDALLAALARIADAEDRDPGDEDVRP